MDDSDRIVFLVDDDAQVRASIADLLASVGINCVAFGSVHEYLNFLRPDIPACIILDIELPDISGLELFDSIAGGDHPPVVFLTGHGDVPSSVKAMKLGAVDFLLKPFSNDDLFKAIDAGVERSRQSRARQEEQEMLQRRLDKLTPREREVLPLVVGGLLNKQAAAELGISEVTFQIHRGRVMQKMQASSLAELVRIAAQLNVPVTRSRHASTS